MTGGKVNQSNKRYSDDVREISYVELKEIIRYNSDVEIVDIRSPQEFDEKRLKGAISIPLYDLKKKAESILKDKNKLIILYCGCGIRSKKAYRILQDLGYTNLYSLKNGVNDI